MPVIREIAIKIRQICNKKKKHKEIKYNKSAFLNKRQVILLATLNAQIAYDWHFDCPPVESSFHSFQ